ncbi:hypothetical protein [Halosimplex sp. J119]
MNRRQFCLGLTAVLTATSGCSNSGSDPTPKPGADSETNSGVTKTSQNRETDTSRGTVTDSGPGSFLPDSTGEWDYRGIRENHGAWSPLGADDGIIGQYQGPDGISYEFVVMDTQQPYTEGTARSLACAGWQVAIAIDGHAIAASTGTEQRTFTPEAPPTITRSAVPETGDRVRKLLVLSPRLEEEDIDDHRIRCEW